MTDIHSCSYYCERPECVRAQRDELRDRQWVELSRDEVLDIEETTTHPLAFYRAISAKLKERNT